MEAARQPWPALGVLLLRDGLVTTEMLESVLSDQEDTRQRRISGHRLGEILVERGLVTPTQIARLVAEQYELPFVELDVSDIELGTASRLDEDIQRRFSTVPLAQRADGSFLLAIADPSTVLFSDELRAALDGHPQFIVVGPEAIEMAIAFVREGLRAAGRTTEESAAESPPDDVAAEPSAGPARSPTEPLETFTRRPVAQLWPPLGALLIREGLVTDADLDAALAQQRLMTSHRLGEILVERGIVTQAQVARCLANQYELPFVELAERALDLECARLLDEEVARMYPAVPIGRAPDGALEVAIGDPTNAFYSDGLRRALDMPLTFVVAAPEEIEATLDVIHAPHLHAVPDASLTAPEHSARTPGAVDLAPEPPFRPDVVEAAPEPSEARESHEPTHGSSSPVDEVAVEATPAIEQERAGDVPLDTFLAPSFTSPPPVEAEPEHSEPAPDAIAGADAQFSLEEPGEAAPPPSTWPASLEVAADAVNVADETTLATPPEIEPPAESETAAEALEAARDATPAWRLELPQEPATAAPEESDPAAQAVETAGGVLSAPDADEPRHEETEALREPEAVRELGAPTEVAATLDEAVSAPSPQLPAEPVETAPEPSEPAAEAVDIAGEPLAPPEAVESVLQPSLPSSLELAPGGPSPTDDVTPETAAESETVADQTEAETEAAAGVDTEEALQLAPGVVHAPHVYDLSEPAETPLEPTPEPADVALELPLERAFVGATSIHFSPRGTEVAVRVRKDGRLAALGSVTHQEAAVYARRLQETGRFTTHGIPTVRGEKTTLVARGRADEPIALEALELPEHVGASLRAVLDEPPGLILVSGPRGSGVTTTSIAALGALSTPDRIVATVEDPVRRLLDGVDQVEVDTAAGVTAAQCVAELLRADTDVILVDELRDRETSEAVVQAAIGGRRVLAGFRAPTTLTALRGLIDLGVDSHTLATAARLVLAQRLVRRVCTSCSETYYASRDELSGLGLDEGPGARLLVRGRGCDACGHTGYRGQAGVFEALPVTSEIRELLLEGASTKKIRRAAGAVGVRTLRDEAIRLCLEGITTAAEVERALDLDD